MSMQKKREYEKPKIGDLLENNKRNTNTFKTRRTRPNLCVCACMA